MMEIVSPKYEYQDIMNKKACSNCLHSAKEHSNDKCFALDYNGTVWSSCRCRNLSFELKIIVNVPIEDGGINHGL